MKAMTPLVTPMLALSLATSLCAQLERPKDAESRSGRPSTEQVFQKLDVNKDGKITFPEFEANPRLERANAQQRKIIFARIDKNEDGSIDPKEMHPGPKARPDRLSWLQKGPVTFEQFSEQPRVQRLDEEKRRQLFEYLDQNGDGKLSKEDSPRRRGEGSLEERPDLKLDSDQDGQISLAEFQLGVRQKALSEEEVTARFRMLDKNNDGFLSREDRPQRGHKNEKTKSKKE